MATFVLVPGFWLGGWAWEDVTRELRAKGHDVHPVTLTGLGDRVHLASPEVTLQTHVIDLVNVLEYADLRDVILVAHSGAGVPVTGAADSSYGRIARMVYIESGPFPDGVAQIDMTDPAEAERVRADIRGKGDGWRCPLPSWERLGGPNGMFIQGLGEAERARMASRATPEPADAITGTLVAQHQAEVDKLPHTLVSCVFPVDQVRELAESGNPMFAGMAGKEWTYEYVPTGHWPMFSAPVELAVTLDKAAQR
jgi:pimeloyl-ACP methyl ester carboxylesterase